MASIFKISNFSARWRKKVLQEEVIIIAPRKLLFIPDIVFDFFDCSIDFSHRERFIYNKTQY